MDGPCPISQTLHTVCPLSFLSWAQPQLCELRAAGPHSAKTGRDTVPHSPLRPRTSAEKIRPSTSPSALRLRSLFPGPFLVSESLTVSKTGQLSQQISTCLGSILIPASCDSAWSARWSKVVAFWTGGLIQKHSQRGSTKCFYSYNHSETTIWVQHPLMMKTVALTQPGWKEILIGESLSEIVLLYYFSTTVYCSRVI